MPVGQLFQLLVDVYQIDLLPGEYIDIECHRVK